MPISVKTVSIHQHCSSVEFPAVGSGAWNMIIINPGSLTQVIFFIIFIYIYVRQCHRMSHITVGLKHIRI